ncbi:MAG: hypothetical protein OHK0022_50000 [Roseiflexaceae bacterium]
MLCPCLVPALAAATTARSPRPAKRSTKDTKDTKGKNTRGMWGKTPTPPFFNLWIGRKSEGEWPFGQWPSGTILLNYK